MARRRIVWYDAQVHSFHRATTTALCLAAPLAGLLSAQPLTELSRSDALAVIELQPKIDAAIDKATEWLLRQQERDGSWSSSHQAYYGGQTGLSTYTLLKAGLPVTHPGVRRALAHLTTVEVDKVYSASAMLLALAESKQTTHKKQIEKLLAQLLGWQRGSWPYPTYEGESHHREQDLSLTQFALLGMRAAVHAGANVPHKAWLDAAKTVLRYQERSREVGEGNARVTAAGFRYRINESDDVTGSMTTAGISSLCIAREGMGRSMPPALGRDITESLVLAQAWLTHHFDVRQNPFRAGPHHYYMYGLERASTLLGLAYYRDKSWYLEGARMLVESQEGNGAWGNPGSDADTCFAVLFLKRATSVTTGSTPKDKRAYLVDDGRDDIAMRAQGGENGDPLTMWIVRVGEPDGLRTYAVEKVTYLVDGNAVVTADGDGKPWQPKATFHAEWQPDTRGKVQIAATVLARRLDADGKPAGDPVELKCRGFKVDVPEVFEPWMLPAATWRARNVMLGVKVTANASSQLNDGRRPEHAADGVEGTQWISAANDPAPRLILDLDKPVSARTLMLTQANGSRAWIENCDLVRKVYVFLNGAKEPIVVEMDANGMAPVRVDLLRTTRVRRIDLAVQAHEGGRQGKGACGFGEVWLEK